MAEDENSKERKRHELDKTAGPRREALDETDVQRRPGLTTEDETRRRNRRANELREKNKIRGF